MLVEQAIFTSARTDRMDGYHLVATSSGVSTEQAEELTAWAPAHDSLLRPDARSGSINFHRLSDGTFCVSKSVPAGAEYSGRGGPKVYTTFLLATADVLERFAHQPFRLLDAVVAAGHLRVMRRFSEDLPPIKLRGRASPALAALLDPLGDAATRHKVLQLACAAAEGNVLVRSGDNLRIWLDRLFNVLPPDRREQLHFSTGLKHSPARAFRLMAAPEDKLDAEHCAKQMQAKVVDLDNSEVVVGFNDEWAQTVDELLSTGRADELLALLHQPATTV